MTPLENNPPSSSTSSSPILVSLPPSSDDDDDDDDNQDEATTKNVDDGIDAQDCQQFIDPLFVPPGNKAGVDGVVVTTDHSAMDPNQNPKQIQPMHRLQRLFSSLLAINQSSSLSSSSSIIANIGMKSKTKFLSMLSLYSKMITSSPSNQDKVIKLLQYTLYICSVTIGNMITKTRSSRSSSLTVSQNGNHSSDKNRLWMLLLSKWMYKLYTEFTWARYILRIVQLPSVVHASIHQTWTLQAVESEKATSSCHDNDNQTKTTRNDESIDTKNRFSRAVNALQCLINYCDTTEQRQKLYNLLGKVLTYSMLWYYPTECMAYLLWMKPSLPEQDVVVSQSDSKSDAITTLSPLATTNTAPLYCTATSPMMMTKYKMLVSYILKYYTTSQEQRQFNPKDKKKLFSSLIMSKLYRVPPETWSYWSCRGWLLYVIAELVQSCVQYSELSKLEKLQQEAKISDSKQDDNTNDDDNVQEQQLQQQYQFQKDQIKLQCIRNILYIIPCVTWSLPKWDSQPIVSNYNVNLILWFESIVSFIQMIRTTQNQK